MAGRPLATISLLAALLACQPVERPEQSPDDDDATDDGDDDDAVDDDDVVIDNPPGTIELSDERVCDDPAEGWQRFTEEAAERGLTRELTGWWEDGINKDVASVIAQDLDGDGDPDLAFGQDTGAPLVYLNGDGWFNESAQLPGFPGRSVLLAAVDLTGDGLPELVSVDGHLSVWTNEGGVFAEPATWETPTDRYHTSMTLGDVDRDGDLDVVAGTGVESPEELTAPPDVLMLNVGGGVFEPWGPLLMADNNGVSTLVSIFTDRDLDGDPDLLAPNNSAMIGGQRTAFFRNDGASGGPVELVDDAPEVGLGLQMAGMGIDSADLNRDGLLDWCITDVGTPVCMFSYEGQPDWFDASVTLGLTPDEPAYPDYGIPTIGWSFEFADLDNDGRLEALQTGAPDHGSGVASMELVDWPDLAWSRGADDVFFDITAELGFGDALARYGVATADFDGDGFLDIVSAGPALPPLLYMNRCDDSSWTEVELVGPGENREGFGAIVEVEDSRGVQMRELYNTRATAQSVSRLHFGLGQDDTIVRLRVRWPDGAIDQAEELPVNRVITVSHHAAR